MDPLTISALIKGGGALAKYGAKRYAASKRNYDQTAYGKELARIKKEGALSQEFQNNVIGQQNRTLSSQAGSIQAQTQGNLINQGLEGSIAGTRALAQPNIERMRELGYTSRDLSAQNAQSKIDAGLQYAQGKTQYNEDTRGMKDEALGGLASDAAGIATDYAVGKVAQGINDKASALEQSRYDTAQKEDILRYEQGRLDKLKGDENAFRTQLAKSLSAMTAKQQKVFIQQLIASGTIQVG
jgi:hypothetical protein